MTEKHLSLPSFKLLLDTLRFFVSPVWGYNVNVTLTIWVQFRFNSVMAAVQGWRVLRSLALNEQYKWINLGKT